MQLTYRGQSFTFESASIRPTHVAGTHIKALQYRGTTYIVHMSDPQPLAKPHVINWRYEVQ